MVTLEDEVVETLCVLERHMKIFKGYVRNRARAEVACSSAGLGSPSRRATGLSTHRNLQEVGWKLAQLAETIHVEFEYRGFVANSLADLDASMLELRPTEVDSVAVNSVLELHKLLARPGANDKVFSVANNIRPDIFTVVEQEANHNSPDSLSDERIIEVKKLASNSER
ncbi:hypothetical protein LWI28_002475 [Acer negundo]|uniref:Uncharacterized protein n=1 Tax=Acer negundo TaxID=4023 RepID=A0AAD5J2I6_ACENE|nr:hypothetical protein LWI28_002475 [Acer negundo]